MTFRQISKFVSILALLAPALAPAQVTPVIFERTSVRIESPTAAAPQEARAPITFSIEVRPEDAMRLEYIHTLNTLTDNSGVMIAFTAPSLVALPMMKVYAPVDALFVDNTGKILQILPKVVLGEMAQEVLAPQPVKAFLFLKSGTAAAQSIRPGDIITGPMFTPAPAVVK